MTQPVADRQHKLQLSCSIDFHKNCTRTPNWKNCECSCHTQNVKKDLAANTLSSNIHTFFYETWNTQKATGGTHFIDHTTEISMALDTLAEISFGEKFPATTRGRILSVLETIVDFKDYSEMTNESLLEDAGINLNLGTVDCRI